MTESEIAKILLENKGKTIRVILDGGAATSLSVLAVDEEGCTCHVLDHSDYDPAVLYWFDLDEIVDIPNP